MDKKRVAKPCSHHTNRQSYRFVNGNFDLFDAMCELQFDRFLNDKKNW